jgi:RNA polymerase sigma factor (sigma-70 family)
MTENEYNHCVDLYADNVYRFILKNLRHEADSKDIVQGAFEKMWMNREQVDNLRSKSYLFTVAYNQMIDHIRKNKRTGKILDESWRINAEYETEEEARADLELDRKKHPDLKFKLVKEAWEVLIDDTKAAE